VCSACTPPQRLPNHQAKNLDGQADHHQATQLDGWAAHHQGVWHSQSALPVTTPQWYMQQPLG
jgi:hypothetical protein